MTPEERQELCALYVLGALEPEEMATVDAHLQAGDPEVVREVAVFRATVALLPHALPPVSPNPAVRTRLMARLQAAQPVPDVPRVSPVRRTLRDRLKTPLVWLPAVAAVLLALLLGRQTAVSRRQIAELEAKAQNLRQIAAEHERLVSLLSLPNVHIVMLSGTEQAAQASARLLWDTKQGEWTVITHELPPLPPGKVYQLWFLTPERPLPSDTFRPDSRGRGVVQTKLPSGAITLAGAAVSLEPEGGSTQPTGSIVLIGKL